MTAPELLAILLGTGGGGRSALEVAADLLVPVEGSVRRLAARPAGELLRMPGVGPAKGARLLAAFELGARLARETRPVLPRIRDPEDVVRVVGPRLRDLAVEEFHLLALDSQSQVLRDVLVTRGLLNSSLVHPREVFRRRHRRGGGGDHRGPQPSERGSDPLGGGPGGDPAAGGGGPAAGPAGVRSRDRRRGDRFT